jgi:DNA-directed RNA polymerase subunit L
MSVKEQVAVVNLKVENWKPKLKNKALEKYMPKTLIPEHCSVDLHGISAAFSNGIRRTIAGELPVKCMIVDYSTFKTDEVFIIPEMVIKRFKMIPIRQTVSNNAKFSLDVRNNTNELIDIKSSEIKMAGGGHLPFNETFTLFTLHPDKYCKIDHITVGEIFGYNAGDGMGVLGVNAAHIVLDQTPFNMYEVDEQGYPIGTPSRISNPRKWQLSFTTNGSMPAIEILKNACANICERLNKTLKYMSGIENNDDEYILTIPGETYTIGKIINRSIHELYPDIRAVTSSVANIGRIAYVKVRTDDDINVIFNSAISHAVKVYTTIRNQLSH